MNIKRAMRKLRREGMDPKIAMNIRMHPEWYHVHPRSARNGRA